MTKKNALDAKMIAVLDELEGNQNDYHAVLVNALMPLIEQEKQQAVAAEIKRIAEAVQKLADELEAKKYPTRNSVLDYTSPYNTEMSLEEAYPVNSVFQEQRDKGAIKILKQVLDLLSSSSEQKKEEQEK